MRVPVEQHPLERDVLAPRHGIRERQHVLEAVEAFGRPVDGPVPVLVEAVMEVRPVRRQTVQRAGRVDDADRLGLALSVQLGVRRHGPLPERGLRAQRSAGRGRGSWRRVVSPRSGRGRRDDRGRDGRRVMAGGEAGLGQRRERMVTGAHVVRRGRLGRDLGDDEHGDGQPAGGGEKHGDEQTRKRRARRKLHGDLLNGRPPARRTGRLCASLDRRARSRARRRAGEERARTVPAGRCWRFP